MPSTVLLEPPREVPTDQLAWVQALVSVCRFTFATQGDLGGAPVTESPHEYALRRWLPESNRLEFDRFVRLIESSGYAGTFLGVRYRYLDVPADDSTSWRYWPSRGVYEPGTTILNRASNSLAPMRPPPPTQLQMEV